MEDVVNRDDYYSLSELHHLTGVNNEKIKRMLLEGDIQPDVVVVKRTYFLKTRFPEIFRLFQLKGFQPKDKRFEPKPVVIDDRFFDFDPIPDYFRVDDEE